MPATDPGELAIAMLLRQAAEARDRAAVHATHWIGVCVADLTALAEALNNQHPCRWRSITAIAETREQRRTVEDIRTMVRRCADAIAAGHVTYRTLDDLRTAALLLRFTRPAPPVRDTAETANPLYNLTIWLLDAISDCTTILQAEQTLRTAAFLGHTNG
ncbi:hypothetical protein [Dactylosporangium sp. NPDC048998]|uniref:hypothetical protein n=1 Tax=Dactylosporangium sp. NPDC048998 TaxID=3363976 RepID=UPI003716E33A